MSQNLIEDRIYEVITAPKNIAPYVFRRGVFWYYYKDWDLPKNGQILRWCSNNDNWFPDEIKNVGSTQSAEILFDVNNKDLKDYKGQIQHVFLSNSSDVMGILLNSGKTYSILLFKTTHEDVQVLLKDIIPEVGVVITNQGIYFGRMNSRTDLAEILYYRYSDRETEKIYTDTDRLRRLVIKETEYKHIILTSSTLTHSKLFIIQQDKKKIEFISDFNKPAHFFSLTHNHIELIGINIKKNRDIFELTLLNADSCEIIYQRVLLGEEIHETLGVKECLILKSVTNGRKILYYIAVEDLLKCDAKICVKDNFNLVGIDETLYENNFSPDFLFTQSYDGINTEFLIATSIKKNERKVISSRETVKYAPVKHQKKIRKKVIYCVSRDGKTKIPVTLFWRGDEYTTYPHNLDTVVNVYGAYGKNELVGNLDPMFRSIVDSGFLVAVAHVRGGGYYGGDWYRAGKQLKKWNSIYDFVDCCNGLITLGISKKESMGALASSAGGIIVGATINYSPELLKSVLLFSPFVNPYDTMVHLDEDKNAFNEVVEWGNPLQSLEVRNYIKSYSPVQNIRPYDGERDLFVSVVSGGRDIFVSDKDIRHWVDLLKDSGLHVKYTFNETAGHGGIGKNDASLLTNIISEYLHELRGE